MDIKKIVLYFFLVAKRRPFHSTLCNLGFGSNFPFFHYFTLHTRFLPSSSFPFFHFFRFLFFLFLFECPLIYTAITYSFFLLQLHLSLSLSLCLSLSLFISLFLPINLKNCSFTFVKAIMRKYHLVASLNNFYVHYLPKALP